MFNLSSFFNKQKSDTPVTDIEISEGRVHVEHNKESSCLWDLIGYTDEFKNELREFNKRQRGQYYPNFEEDIIVLLEIIVTSFNTMVKDGRIKEQDRQKLYDYLVPRKELERLKKEKIIFCKGYLNDFVNDVAIGIASGSTLFDKTFPKEFINKEMISKIYSNPDDKGIMEFIEFYEPKNYEQIDPEKIFEQINNLEQGLIPILFDSGVISESIHFDYVQFINNPNADKAADNLEIERADLSEGDSITGLHVYMKNSSFRRVASSYKSKSVDSHKSLIMSTLYLLGSIVIFAQNIARTDNSNKTIEECIKDLKKKEIFYHFKHDKYQRYINLIKQKKDVHNLTPTLHNILDKSNKDVLLAYSSLFKDKDKRDNLDYYSSDNFTTIWINAFNTGWGKELTENLEHIEKALIDDNTFAVISNQKTGSLAELLTDPNFNKYFRNNTNKLDNADFDSLKTLRDYNKTLFEKIYTLVNGDNMNFVESLILIERENKHEYKNITINEKIKEFIQTLPDFEQEYQDKIYTLITNYKTAQKAADNGLSPYSKKPEDIGQTLELGNIEDKLGFIDWFYENKDKLIKHFKTLKKVNSCFGDNFYISQDRLARIIEIYGQSHSVEYKLEFEKLGTRTSKRMLELLSEVDMKRILRKREFRNALKYTAFTLPNESWKEFTQEMKVCNRFWKVLKKYHAFENTEQIYILEEIAGPILSQVYENIKQTKHEDSFYKLINLMVSSNMGYEVFDKVLSYFSPNHFGVASLIIGEKLHGTEDDMILNLLEYYDDDSSLDTPVKEVKELYVGNTQE